MSSQSGVWSGARACFCPEQPLASCVFPHFQVLSFRSLKSSPSWSKGPSYGWPREEPSRAAIQVRTPSVGAANGSSPAGHWRRTSWKEWWLVVLKTTPFTRSTQDSASSHADSSQYSETNKGERRMGISQRKPGMSLQGPLTVESLRMCQAPQHSGVTPHET
uniref:Macaca fascicularis brain cDNA clone: QflA-18088, similar to human zinc finger protein 544 (ZNF544), mRNA, RefSeq: NM_014480.1 n=1 Tax=Macaca fascicularis TaxID=9541 RepID=I7GMS2_MACFA|nr:unnamed protein product [Macaca fascicularis]